VHGFGIFYTSRAIVESRLWAYADPEPEPPVGILYTLRDRDLGVNDLITLTQIQKLWMRDPNHLSESFTLPSLPAVYFFELTICFEQPHSVAQELLIPA
jgi:hypothetical protein